MQRTHGLKTTITRGTKKKTIAIAYGFFIVMDGIIEQHIKTLREKNAERKVDIAIQYKDQTKEFTLKEFLGKLGIEYSE